MKLLLAALLSLSGCYLHQFPITLDIAEASTYRLESDTAQGTGWVVADHYVMTAGHMCWEARTLVLTSTTGRRLLGTPLVTDLSTGSDLCIVKVAGPLAPPLVLADRMPKVGAKVAFVGWPMGHFVRSEGAYLGDLDHGQENMTDNSYAFSAQCDHGASGSAVYGAGGVFGVLVRVRTDGGRMHDGSDGCVVTPISDIRAMLKEADIDPALAPPQPSDYPVSPPQHPLG